MVMMLDITSKPNHSSCINFFVEHNSPIKGYSLNYIDPGSQAAPHN